MKTKSSFFKKNLSGWLILLPGVILFAFYVWVPLGESMWLSLFKTKGFHAESFVGIQNYIDVFRHPDFGAAMANTFTYIGWSLLIGFLTPLVISLIILETRRGQAFFRFTSYFPNIVPGLATVLMWGFLFRSGQTGVLNILLGKIGIEPLVWLADKDKVIPLIIITMTWKSAGATALTYMAGLSGINPELYDAAAIDGAGVWKRLFSITVPQLFKLGSTMLILQIISVFQILYEPLVLTNGGPNNASISIMQLVWRYAFEKYDYGHATAVSVIICAILIVLTMVYNRITRKANEL
ncbi:MAG TPA: sugar ABC transporter permease [Clostridia bacterium]|nr:sugar ABC transporter permease [Clostridia bacterium]